MATTEAGITEVTHQNKFFYLVRPDILCSAICERKKKMEEVIYDAFQTTHLKGGGGKIGF